MICGGVLRCIPHIPVVSIMYDLIKAKLPKNNIIILFKFSKYQSVSASQTQFQAGFTSYAVFSVMSHTYCRMNWTASSYFIPHSIKASATRTGALQGEKTRHKVPIITLIQNYSFHCFCPVSYFLRKSFTCLEILYKSELYVSRGHQGVDVELFLYLRSV